MVNACSIHAMWSISIILSIFKIFICSYQCELITAKTEKVGYIKAHVYYNPESMIGTLHKLENHYTKDCSRIS